MDRPLAARGRGRASDGGPAPDLGLGPEVDAAAARFLETQSRALGELFGSWACEPDEDDPDRAHALEVMNSRHPRAGAAGLFPGCLKAFAARAAARGDPDADGNFARCLGLALAIATAGHHLFLPCSLFSSDGQAGSPVDVDVCAEFVRACASAGAPADTPRIGRSTIGPSEADAAASAILAADAMTEGQKARFRRQIPDYDLSDDSL